MSFQRGRNDVVAKGSSSGVGRSVNVSIGLIEGRDKESDQRDQSKTFQSAPRAI